jgi:type 1 glutamine amidotransferase
MSATKARKSLLWKIFAAAVAISGLAGWAQADPGAAGEPERAVAGLPHVYEGTFHPKYQPEGCKSCHARAMVSRVGDRVRVTLDVSHGRPRNRFLLEGRDEGGAAELVGGKFKVSATGAAIKGERVCSGDRRSPIELLPMTAETPWNVPIEDIDVPEQSLQGARKAMPEKAPLEAKAPRKLLVFCRTNPLRFQEIALAARVLEEMGKQTGAYEAVVTEDAASLERQRLSAFDAVLFDCGAETDLLPNDFAQLSKREKAQAKELADRRLQSLIAYVEDGHGFVGLNTAAACCQESPQYARMLGGCVSEYLRAVQMKVADPDSAIVASFTEDAMKLKDETYLFESSGGGSDSAAEACPTGGNQVLLSIDVDDTGSSRQLQKAGKPKDGTYALSWTRKHGKGRIFYTSLGHSAHTYQRPDVLQHVLAGIQYALGD